MFERAAIIGLGLIGGSIARALKGRGLAREVVGAGNSLAPLEGARREGVIDRLENDPAAVVKGADLVILATPLARLGPLLEALWPAVDGEALLTDVGSVKGPLVRLADRLALSRPLGFIGGHPMAGSEKRGFFASRADLFEGTLTILTPGAATIPGTLKRARALWEGIGSRVVECSPEEHDRIVAAVSHLPHLVAYALSAAVASLDEALLGYAAGGFKDTTRIAASPAALWREIFELNRAPLIEMVARYRAELDRLEGYITTRDWDALEQALEAIRRQREHLQ